MPPFLQPLKVPMADLAAVLPYTGFIQAKFFEIDETLTDPHIPWADIVHTLRDGGYAGWLSSEYQGRRERYPHGSTLEEGPITEKPLPRLAAARRAR